MVNGKIPPQSIQMSVASLLMVVKLSQNAARGNARRTKSASVYLSPSHAVRGDHALEGIGQPREARIISLEQPAQQWYMRGAATEIER